MIKNAVQMLKENYDRLGDLTDAQFIVAKAKACAKRLIYAEQIMDCVKIDFVGNSTPINLNEIAEGDTLKIKATVRNMAGGKEKTGYVTLNNIRDVQYDNAIKMLTLETDNMILTTIECKAEIIQLDSVIRGVNWVNEHSLSELISNDTLLSDFKMERDEREHNRSLEDIDFVETKDNSTIFPELLF